MIPLLYQLRKEIRFRQQGASYLVWSETPLNVVRVTERGMCILNLCDGTKTINDLAGILGGLDENQIFKLCDYFRAKGILEISTLRSEDFTPAVTVIIPTKDRHAELAECLDSVYAQDYPPDKIEVIVIDDGSKDLCASPAHQYPCKLLWHEQSRGQSYCRNLGAQQAQGEILAFLDSDCVATPGWLRNLASAFIWSRIGAVGGYVDGYFDGSSLDRYEKASSPLNMGRHIQYASDDRSTFYVPTCNLLVRKSVYEAVGGIREDLHVGEDVDFCWRMRQKSHDLLYLPSGTVRHKHRSKLGSMLKRRIDYGTSEAALYKMHPAKRKYFHLPFGAAFSLLAGCAAILLMSVLPVLAAILCFLIESGIRAIKFKKLHLGISLLKILFSQARTYSSFFYVGSFHLVRYYFSLMLMAGFLSPGIWFLAGSMLLVASGVDYRIKKPRLAYPAFLFYYMAEHISYQIGVLLGCLRAKTFGSYVPVFGFGKRSR